MRWGDRADAIAAALALPPPVDLTLRDARETQVWAEKLGGISLMPGHLRLPRGQAIESLEGYAEGFWWVQDIAASLPARLLGPGEGRTVLDVCAAPGGKTLQLAAAGWNVTALDNSAKRLERLRENLERTGLKAEVIVADALRWSPGTYVDAILLDAPCTATGTCRRHPDVLHRIGPRQIEEMAELQASLIARASDWLKPGGEMIYSVCSLEPEEGEDQIENAALDAAPVTAEFLPQGIMSAPQGWLRTDPAILSEVGGMDGFFISRFINK